MKKFDDLGPILLAVAIALGTTLIARVLVPYIENQVNKDKIIPKPQVPFLDNSQEQNKDVSIAVASADIAKFAKITTANVTWRKWPGDGLTGNYVVKDGKNKIIQNEAFLGKLIGQYAKEKIMHGVPLVNEMFTDEDLQEKERKRKLEEEEIKKIERGNTISPLMRALTVQVDQRSAVSYGMIKHGDYVDILYHKRSSGGSEKLEKIRCIKILAIDGKLAKKVVLDKDGKPATQDQQVESTTPRTVTLELTISDVEELVKYASDRGVIISLRPLSEQNPKKKNELASEDDDDPENANSDIVKDKTLKIISDINDGNVKQSSRLNPFFKSYSKNTDEEKTILKQLRYVAEYKSSMPNQKNVILNKDMTVKMNDISNTVGDNMLKKKHETPVDEEIRALMSKTSGIDVNLRRMQVEGNKSVEINNAILKVDGKNTVEVLQKNARNSDRSNEVKSKEFLSGVGEKNIDFNLKNQQKERSITKEASERLRNQNSNASIMLKEQKIESEISSHKDKYRIQLVSTLETSTQPNNKLQNNKRDFDVLKQIGHYTAKMSKVEPELQHRKIESSHERDFTYALSNHNGQNVSKQLRDNIDQREIAHYNAQMSFVQPKLQQKYTESKVETSRMQNLLSLSVASGEKGDLSKNGNSINQKDAFLKTLNETTQPADKSQLNQKQRIDDDCKMFAFNMIDGKDSASQVLVNHKRQEELAHNDIAVKIQSSSFNNANVVLKSNYVSEIDSQIIPILYETQNAKDYLIKSVDNFELERKHFSSLSNVNADGDHTYQRMVDNMRDHQISMEIANKQAKDLSQMLYMNNNVAQLQSNYDLMQKQLQELRGKKEVSQELIKLDANKAAVVDELTEHEKSAHKELVLRSQKCSIDHNSNGKLELLHSQRMHEKYIKGSIADLSGDGARNLADAYYKHKKYQEKKNNECLLSIFRKVDTSNVTYSKKNNKILSAKNEKSDGSSSTTGASENSN